MFPARVRAIARRVLAKLKRMRGSYAPRVPSELFDRDWYLRAYPDVARSGQDPVEHYLRHGHRDGRAPTEQIWRLGELAAEALDPAWYLARYPDVARLGYDPATHYLSDGRREGRHPNLAHARAEAWVQAFGER